MIEWKKWEGESLKSDWYLTYRNGTVAVARQHWYKPGSEDSELCWELDGGYLIFGVTHYAQINLPEPERGGLVNPDGGDYPLKWMGRNDK